MAENEEVLLDGDDELDLETEPEGDQIDFKAEASKLRGSAKRYKNQAAKLKAELEAERKKSEALAHKGISDKNTFDYAEKAYLKSSGILPDEFDLVREVMQHTGKSLDDVLESKHFQAELKEQRETKATKEAVPSGTKRASSPAKDSVEYWLGKGELPPADQRELRQKIVEARIKAEKSKTVFTDRPVV